MLGAVLLLWLLGTTLGSKPGLPNLRDLFKNHYKHLRVFLKGILKGLLLDSLVFVVTPIQAGVVLL